MALSKVPYDLLSGTASVSQLPAQLSINSGASSGSLAMDSAGRVTMPYQPAFGAARSSTTYSTASVVISFNTVYVNVGSCYNSSTGVFTAPVSGNYLFGFSGIAGTGASGTTVNGTVDIRKNGTAVKTIHWNHADAWESIAGDIIISLSVNDYVDFYIGSLTGVGNSVYGGANYTSGYGYLIG